MIEDRRKLRRGSRHCGFSIIANVLAFEHA